MDEEREHDQDNHLFGFVSGLLLGAVIGASIALLAAPESGNKTRKRLRRTAVGIKRSATDRLDDLADEMKGKVDEVVKTARTRFVS
jgi:gas vesicle protein